MTAHIDGIDEATNRGKRKTVYFIKEGTTYITADMDKDAVKPGEVVNYTIKLNNARDLKTARFVMKINPTLVEIQDESTLRCDFLRKCRLNLYYK